MLLASAGSAWLVYSWRQFAASPLPQVGSATLQVEPGTSVHVLLRRLSRRYGQPLEYWKGLYWLEGQQRPIQAGEYRLIPGDTPRDLVQRLLAGQVVEHVFRIQEGWNWRQLRAAVEHDARLKMDLSPETLQDLQRQLAPGAESLEGLFFPDSYRFQRGAPASGLLLRAGRWMQQQLEQAWQQRDRRIDAWIETPYQALILASIVEKETAQVGEMPRIAGVFYNRLRKNMRLQTDPTVIYGLGEAFDGNLRRRDLRQPTPWNTYVIRGLPPTPICMPGRAAIDAVMRPENHAYLFFVADGSGGHYFSTHYEEHRRAVNQYQIKDRP